MSQYTIPTVIEKTAGDFLRPAVEASFNSISVDGECSTNDTVLLLANGAAPVDRTGSRTWSSSPSCSTAR